MPERAVIVIQFGPVPAARQRDGCLEYIHECGYLLVAVVGVAGNSQDAVTKVARGEAEVVVVAMGGRALAGDVTAAGGRVEALRPHPHVVQPYRPAAPSLAAQLADRGKSVEEIAEILGESTGDIRRKLSE